MAERKRLEEEARKKQEEEETWQREEDRQRSGQTFRDGSRRCHGTTTVQELDEDLSAALISSFR